MIDALIELGVIDKIVISIIVIVLLISLNNYFGGPKNHSIRDLHQRNIILAVCNWSFLFKHSTFVKCYIGSSIKSFNLYIASVG